MPRISRKSNSIDRIWYDTYEIDEIDTPAPYQGHGRYRHSHQYRHYHPFF
jgi:hypothetical protein